VDLSTLTQGMSGRAPAGGSAQPCRAQREDKSDGLPPDDNTNQESFIEGHYFGWVSDKLFWQIR
jgi:hypothetical protein